MSRADEVRRRYEAELAVLDLEDELVAAKAAGTVTDELKLRLREARRVFRAEREPEPFEPLVNVPDGKGGWELVKESEAQRRHAAVSPDVIAVSTDVPEV